MNGAKKTLMDNKVFPILWRPMVPIHNAGRKTGGWRPWLMRRRQTAGA